MKTVAKSVARRVLPHRLRRAIRGLLRPRNNPGTAPRSEPALQTTSPAGAANPWNADKPFDYSTLWFGAKPCRDYIYQTVSGDLELNPVPYFIRKYVLARPPGE